MRLYLIEILHQTTTHRRLFRKQPLLYLIEILHQTTTLSDKSSLILCCILSKFYIKPQRRQSLFGLARSCILSKFYIKPQLEDAPQYVSRVVSYRNSTSNHNASRMHTAIEWLYLIEILHQTTTRHPTVLWTFGLYLIEILHQTTTARAHPRRGLRCILSKFYIKPQHSWRHVACGWRCILSKFYIKPQRRASY